MAGIWGVFLHVMFILVSLSSTDASENPHDVEYNFEGQSANDADIVSEDKSDLDPHFFQDGGYSGPQSSPFQSKWDLVKHDIRKVLDGFPQGKAIQPDTQEGDKGPELSSDLPNQMSRGQTLKNLYHRLLLASKDKRSLYGNVLKGYKLGKREFMPYELMNEYQKRLFGSVLNNYKFGKRVPEELPANYLTGGQIYDITDDPRERKRMFGSILSSYKLGKRIPRIERYNRALRGPVISYPSYRIPRENLYQDS